MSLLFQLCTSAIAHFSPTSVANNCCLIVNKGQKIFSLLTGLALYTNNNTITTMKAIAIISIITLVLNIFILSIEGQSIVVKGNDCEFINLDEITSNTGCDSGTKYVLKVFVLDLYL